MTDQEKRLLTEFLGECWHESSGMTWICGKCKTDVGWLGETMKDAVAVETLRLDFTDWRVVGRLIEKTEDVEVWYFHEDMEWCARVLEREIHSAKSPQEAICAAVLAWLKEGGK